MKKFSGLSMIYPANAQVIEGNIKGQTADLLFVETMVGTGKKAALKLKTFARADIHHFGQADSDSDFKNWLTVGGAGKTTAEEIEGDVALADLGNGWLRVTLLDTKLVYELRAAQITLEMDSNGKIKPFTIETVGGKTTGGTSEADADEEEADEEEAAPAKKGAKAKATAKGKAKADDEEEEEEEEEEPKAKGAKAKGKAADDEEDEGDDDDAEDPSDDEVTQEEVDELEAADKKAVVAAYNEHDDCEDEITLKSLKNVAKLNQAILIDVFDELFGEAISQEDIDGLETADKKALVKAYNDDEDLEGEPITLKTLKDIEAAADDETLDLDLLGAKYEELFGEGDDEEDEGDDDADEEDEGDDDGDDEAGDDSDADDEGWDD